MKTNEQQGGPNQGTMAREIMKSCQIYFLALFCPEQIDSKKIDSDKFSFELFNSCPQP